MQILIISLLDSVYLVLNKFRVYLIDQSKVKVIFLKFNIYIS